MLRRKKNQFQRQAKTRSATHPTGNRGRHRPIRERESGVEIRSHSGSIKEPELSHLSFHSRQRTQGTRHRASTRSPANTSVVDVPESSLGFDLQHGFDHGRSLVAERIGDVLRSRRHATENPARPHFRDYAESERHVDEASVPQPDR